MFKLSNIRSLLIYNRSLLESFFSLSLMQALNGLLPLVTIPYLLDVIHADKFGLINISQAVIYYFQILVDYGFNMTATRQIAIYRDNLNRISSIFSAVLIIKLLLTGLGAVLLFLIVNVAPSFRENSNLFYLTYLTVIGYAFFPTWFFQGIEKMRYLTLLNLVAKVIFTVLIFLCVKKEKDYLLVPVFTGLGFIISSVLAIFIACYVYKVNLRKVNKRHLLFQLNDGFPIFISNFSISFYRSANPILLGFFTNSMTVGYYSVAEKLMKGLQSIVNSLAQALFPHMSRKLETYLTTQMKVKAIFKPTIMISVGLVLISLVIYFTASFWVELFVHSKNNETIACLRILSFVITFGGINYLLGFIGLININQRKALMLFVVLSGVIAIISAAVLSYYLGSIGAAYSMLFAEVILLIFLLLKYYSLRKMK